MRKAEIVQDPTVPEVAALVEDMIETMIDADGAGLAAPQIYESKQIVVFQAPPERVEDQDAEESFDHTAPLTVLINPEIEVLTEDFTVGWEGCLSVPGMRGLVPRPLHIKYQGLSPSGETIEREARGFHARVVLHECDHLNGVLYPQRMEDLSALVFETEFRHWIEQEGATE